MDYHRETWSVRIISFLPLCLKLLFLVVDLQRCKHLGFVRDLGRNLFLLGEAQHLDRVILDLLLGIASDNRVEIEVLRIQCKF